MCRPVMYLLIMTASVAAALIMEHYVAIEGTSFVDLYSTVIESKRSRRAKIPRCFGDATPGSAERSINTPRD